MISCKRGQAALGVAAATARPLLRGQAALGVAAATARPLLRGQAALEYLMTYGWALLVIAIVIAVLVAINPFSAPQSCKFDQIGLLCGQPAMNTTGHLFAQITNANNNDLNITGWACVSDKSSAPPASFTPISPAITLSRQAQLDTSSSAIKVVCQGAAGFARGSDYTGKLWLRYRNSEDPSSYPNRTSSASISVKVS